MKSTQIRERVEKVDVLGWNKSIAISFPNIIYVGFFTFPLFLKHKFDVQFKTFHRNILVIVLFESINFQRVVISAHVTTFII